LEGKARTPAALRATPSRGQRQRPGEAGSTAFLGCVSLLLRVGCRGVPGLAPAGDSLSFASPKESKQRKGEPKSAALRASLHCSVRSGCAQTRCAQTCAPLVRAPLRCSARPDGKAGSGSGAGAGFLSGQRVPVCVPVSAPACRRHALASSAGLGGSRAAHVRRPRSGQVCADPAQTEQRSVPEAQRRDSAFGSPFFWVLFFGEAKKSASPAGARPGQTKHPEKQK